MKTFAQDSGLQTCMQPTLRTDSELNFHENELSANEEFSRARLVYFG